MPPAIGSDARLNVITATWASIASGVFCVALSFPALFVAPIAGRWSTPVPVMLFRQPFAVCLCAITVRLLVRS